MLALPSWVVAPDWSVTGYVLLAAGLAQAMRLLLWRGVDTRTEPLVWILHVGYAFVPIGMLAMGTAVLWPGALLNVAVQHIWMAGAIGVMTLAVMTRATLGHTGHALTAGIGTTGVYLAVIASVLLRLLGGVLPDLGVVALHRVCHLVVFRFRRFPGSLRVSPDSPAPRKVSRTRSRPWDALWIPARAQAEFDPYQEYEQQQGPQREHDIARYAQPHQRLHQRRMQKLRRACVPVALIE